MMNTLYFEYPRMVSFTPPGGEPAQVTAIQIVAASEYRFGADGVWVNTDQGEAIVPYGFTAFRQSPFIERPQ